MKTLTNRINTNEVTLHVSGKYQKEIIDPKKKRDLSNEDDLDLPPDDFSLDDLSTDDDIEEFDDLDLEDDDF
ncbi:MAG: hypothetical protein WBP45_01110 [Daejeonella sp.]